MSEVSWFVGDCMIAHAKELDKLPIALVQSPGDDGLAFVLWQRNRHQPDHDDQLLFRRTRAHNFGAFSLKHVDAATLLLWRYVGIKFHRPTGRVCSEPLPAGYHVAVECTLYPTELSR